MPHTDITPPRFSFHACSRRFAACRWLLPLIRFDMSNDADVTHALRRRTFRHYAVCRAFTRRLFPARRCHAVCRLPCSQYAYFADAAAVYFDTPLDVATTCLPLMLFFVLLRHVDALMMLLPIFRRLAMLDTLPSC